MQAKIGAKRADAAASADLYRTVSFTTRQGKTYDSVRAWLGDDGVEVLTPDGAVTVALADLPADLSAFPAGWRASIEAEFKAAKEKAGALATISFTTRRGKDYSNVRAGLGGDEVMVLSPNGWIFVPFGDLPADLSPFSGQLAAAHHDVAQDFRRRHVGHPGGELYYPARQAL